MRTVLRELVTSTRDRSSRIIQSLELDNGHDSLELKLILPIPKGCKTSGRPKQWAPKDEDFKGPSSSRRSLNPGLATGIKLQKPFSHVVYTMQAGLKLLLCRNRLPFWETIKISLHTAQNVNSRTSYYEWREGHGMAMVTITTVNG